MRAQNRFEAGSEFPNGATFPLCKLRILSKVRSEGNVQLVKTRTLVNLEIC